MLWPRAIWMLGLGSAAILAWAQSELPITPFNQSQTTPESAKKVVAGTPSIDIVRIDAMVPSVPLRKPGIVEGSETIFLGAELLARGTDYYMDYATGVVYLMRAVKPGTALRASYRYVPNYVAPSQQFAGLGAFRYNLVPGAMSFNLGMGLTERQANGNVTSSNVFGWNNSLKFGQGGSLSGALVLGQKKNVDAKSGFDASAPKVSTQQENSQAIVQSLTSDLGGGVFQANYQDISDDFTQFNALVDSGIAADQVAKMQKEKGLSRLGFSFKDIGLGLGKVSQSYREVVDGDSKITWESYGFAHKGLSASLETQKVDSKFRRFKDLSEADQAQLAKEVGMQREKMQAEYKAGFGKLSYQANEVAEASGQGIRRSELALDTGKIKFNLGDQEVDSGFTRFANLFEAEKTQWGRERGLSRRWMALDANVFGGTVAPIKFNQSIIASQTGKYASSSVDLGGKGWALSHVRMGTEGSFGNLGALAQSEIDNDIKRIATMYDPQGFATKPEERSWFTRGEGLTRDATRLDFSPNKDWKASFSQLNFTGQKDGGYVQTLGISNPRMSLNVRRQNLGDQFAEVGNLMMFERERLGGLMGINRTDVALQLKPGGKKSVAVDSTELAVGDSGLSRTKINYTDTGVDISYAKRRVDDQFGASKQLIDSERDLLANLQGFNEEDYRVKWQLLPNLSFDIGSAESSRMGGDEFRKVRNILLAFKPDKATDFSYVSNQAVHSDSAVDLFRNELERFVVSRNLGRYGLVRYMKESQEYLNAGLVGFDKEYFAYETKINPTTDVKTEQTRTAFDDGTREKISANSVSTTLNKRTGVTVADVAIDRHGDTNDVHKRNAGFWYDLGNGIRLSYGYNRQLVGNAGTTQENLVLAATPGSAGAPKLGNVDIGAASYAANEWDGTRVQATSNVQLSTSKPFSFGPIKDAKMAFGFDALADKTAWVKENRMFSFDGKWGSNTLGLNYRSQIHTSGYRAIDRSLSFATDQGDKRFIKGSVFLKQRSLPFSAEDLDIQNINVTVKPAKNIELSHQLIQNPEVVQANQLLGSVVQASRSEKWRLDMKQSDNLTIGGSYEELANSQSSTMTRAAGLNVTLNEKSGSPIQLYYGLEESDRSGARKTAHRYHLKFDQRPGPNQMLSFFLGNVSYEHNFDSGGRDNWTLRMDYQLRF